MLNHELVTELLKHTGGKHSVYTLNEAYSFCEKVVKMHYENFPVASFLVPRSYRKNIFAVYSFARLADDIADEYMDKEQRLSLLEKLEGYLVNRTAKKHPIFNALYDTIDEKNIPLDPFLRLLTAFKSDSEFTKKETLQDILNYCNLSANPVGELILRLSGEFDEEKLEYSDQICTALQLANFWQDLSVDIPNGRIYIPFEFFQKSKIDPNDLYDPKRKELIMHVLYQVYDLTERKFQRGKKLIPLLKSRLLRIEIAMTLAGGRLILKKSMKLGIRIFYKRPELRKFEFIPILIRILMSPKTYL